MSTLLAQAFGSAEVDLYEDVLKVSRDCSLAKLRKAYYQQALKYHPDKNPGDDAKLKFQAVSWTYQLLRDPERRADYDRSGVIPHDDDIDSDENENHGTNSWKDYFDTIFGKLSTSDIDKFAIKYKMSDEEERDVLKHYEQFKGNLVKMLEYVMLSEERDVARWLEDYIHPAIASGKVPNYADKLRTSAEKVQKKLDKESTAAGSVASSRGSPKDAEETETEESDSEHMPNPTKRKSQAKRYAQKKPPKKANHTKSKAKTKTKKTTSSQEDLIEAIRNKKNRANPLASIGARYGVTMGDDDDDDPLDDAAFAKLQSKYKRK